MNSSNDKAFTGAYTVQEDLLALRFQARLQLASRKRSLSSLAGPYRSSFRGRGMDFEEVRAYQAGDETRSIDWRVTARTTIPHTKLFREERERPVLILVDQRSQMFFGSQRCFKSVLAAQAAGLLAWSALAMNDRVGGLILGNREHTEVRPKRGKSSLLKLLHTVHDYNTLLSAESGLATAITLEEGLQDLRRIARPGSAIYLLSDFHDFSADSARHLFHIARHNEVTALNFYDALEQSLPPAGQYTVSDGQQRGLLDSRQQQTRNSFANDAQARHQQLHDDFARNGVPMIDLQTGCDPLTELLRYFSYKRG